MNSLPTGAHRATNRMNGWEILEEAIPRGEADAIANLLGLSGDTVRRWRREPEAGDDMSTGRRSPLDVILLLINAVYTRNPQGAELIVERVIGEISNLRRIHGHTETMPIEQLEGELRSAIKSMARVADQFAGVNGNEGIRGNRSPRSEREGESMADQSEGRPGRSRRG
jgi:hypothetical protein